MSLIPWKSFSDFDYFFKDDDWMMPVMSKAELYKPAMDVYETDKEIVIKANIPGFDLNDIDISVEDGTLKVSGKMEEEKEDSQKGYWKKEIRQGSFERIIRLPPRTKPGDIVADYEKGVLNIRIQKSGSDNKERFKIDIKEKK
ncbi:MAG: Hsp20/alpha crystallin family protein [Minisyncoccus archaeiphilus]|uniref:Hsp20/alpha crystallin family protein n=1 Tax=Minisyncoccus archaeiphilus TaxID=3238481 RepID=UPI0009D2E719|nr:MAG: Spore protein SP21 [Parcubacteria group bacterium ADurb.Bin216]GMX59065.1 MAG: Hsp20/alpha crystallin family protein [Candidatus Parcubacteria bacterium]